MTLTCCIDECKNKSIEFVSETDKEDFDNHMRFFYCEEHKPERIKRYLVDEYPKYFKGK